MNDLAVLSASAMVEGHLARRFSPVEVLEATIARIERLDPGLNAVVHIDVDRARAAARRAEREILAGRPVGPLCGVPVGVKDVVDVAGMPTTCHSRILVGNTATVDASAVRRLREAGAIILAKLATHEFALGGPSLDLPFPPARNPWHMDYNPGGSSSGSGAAVAASLFPFAVGTDTAGSIRHPAGACGVLGLKPTYDAIPRDGVFPLAHSLDHVGPLARTAGDIDLAFRVMAGLPATGLQRKETDGLPVRRVGYVRHFHSGDVEADPQVSAALDVAVQRLMNLGVEVEEVTLPPLGAFLTVSRIVMFAEAFAIHSEWLRTRPQDYGALGRQRLMVGAFLTAEDYLQAQRRRRQLNDAVEDVLSRNEVLLVANMFDPACRLDDAVELVNSGRRQARSPFNATGHPAISFCTGFSSAGLPLSGQLVGKRGSESIVTEIAGLLHEAGVPTGTRAAA